MAQVYQFVDDNGVTRLFAEIVPEPVGTPFNGGTITNPLVINTGDANTVPETIEASLGAQATNFWAIHDTDGGGQDLVYVDSHGGFNVGDFGIFTSGNFQAQLSSLFNGRVTVSQGLNVTLHAAPSDGSLSAGDCVLWFDQTDGAAKLMVKAKTANGTVATAAIALA